MRLLISYIYIADDNTSFVYIALIYKYVGKKTKIIN